MTRTGNRPGFTFGEPYMPYKVDKVTLRRLLMVKHDYQPSVRRVFREIGMESKYKGTEIWSDAVAIAVAEHLGVDVNAFSVRTGDKGRPRFERAGRCPVKVPLEPELRNMITKAAKKAGMKPGAWVWKVLRESAVIQIGEGEQQ